MRAKRKSIRSINDIPEHALSIKQPWASLIVSGIKDVDSRNWSTRFRGRVAVHAPVRSDGEAFALWKDFHAGEIEPVTRTDHELAKIECPYPFLNSMPAGGYIGEVDIVDCVDRHASPWVDRGSWSLVLENPVIYDRLIEARGAVYIYSTRKGKGRIRHV